MLKKILPILLALIGLGAGIGGGIALRPDQEIVVIDPCGDVPAHDTHEAEVLEEGDDDASSEFEYVKLNNQFVVPEIGRASCRERVFSSV